MPDLASPTWRGQLDFDVRPFLGRLRLPVLLLYGQLDQWVPIEASLGAWRSALGPDADFTVAIIPSVGHRPTLATDPRDPSDQAPIAPEYERVLLSWLRRLDL